LYKILKTKKNITLENYQNYIIGIAKKKIQRHYGLLYQLKNWSTFSNSEIKEYEMDLPSNIDVEADIVIKLNAKEVWDYIKQKNIIFIKVFYLYYYSDLKISQIATELNISES